MKKIYFVLATVLLTCSAIAQTKRFHPTEFKHGSRKECIQQIVRDNFAEKTKTKNEFVSNIGFSVSPSAKSMWLWEQVIGYTTYDNQSNNSMQTRVFVDANEVVHGTWTMSFQNNTTWTDRGTGYNSGEGYIWEVEPYERLESVRTGWPGLVMLGNNAGEAIFNHDGTASVTMHKRSTVGSGDWTSTDLPTDYENDFLWPRAVVDGNYVHVLAMSVPSGLDGTPLNGLNGNLVYWRSNDNGTTWNIQGEVFPQLDSAEYAGLESDSYAIDAKNGRVSIAIFSEIHDSMILTSEDNGNTWESQIFNDFPIAGYESGDLTDFDLDGNIDTVNVTTDGTGAVLIDNSGVTHISFGRYAFLDDDDSDSLYTVFLVDELLYWNNTMATNDFLTIGLPEESGNDLDDLFDITVDQSPDYRTSAASMPAMGIDADGIIYVVYSAMDEDYLGDQCFRHIYVTTSADGGGTWIDPIELTPDEDFDEYEYVFPTMARDIDDKLHLVIQRDNEPGLSVRGDLDDSDENSMIYLAVTTDFDLTIGIGDTAVERGNFNVYPNPSTGVLTITGNNLANANMKIYNQLGQEMLSTKLGKNFNAGDRQTFDLSYLPNGKYSVVIGSGKNKMTKEILINR
jgi:hypothetical protein